MLVNLNIVSDRLSAKESIGRRFASLNSESAMANRMLNTTTCNTWPSATDLAIFSGKTWSRMSVTVCRGAAASCSACAVGGSLTPTPALLTLMAAKPMNSATVVTTSKYTSALIPIRPIFFRSAWPAMPTTSVPNSSGAMMVLIRRRKIRLSTRSLTANAGQSWPISAPTTMLTRMAVVSERRASA